MSEANQRVYSVHGQSTSTFGRVLVSTRDQHLVADGPVYNDCPGEAIGPAELFLGGVASCGVELVQVLARTAGLPVPEVSVSIQGTLDPSHRIRPDVNLFASVRMHFSLSGVSQEQAQDLVERFKGR